MAHNNTLFVYVKYATPPYPATLKAFLRFLMPWKLLILD
jgi:hypothetical protein